MGVRIVLLTRICMLTESIAKRAESEYTGTVLFGSRRHFGIDFT